MLGNLFWRSTDHKQRLNKTQHFSSTFK